MSSVFTPYLAFAPPAFAQAIGRMSVEAACARPDAFAAAPFDVVDLGAMIPAAAAPEEQARAIRLGVLGVISRLKEAGKAEAAFLMPNLPLSIAPDHAARAVASALFAFDEAPNLKLLIVSPDDALLATFREAIDVVANGAHYLRKLNFDSREFARVWDEIFLGSSNEEFFLRAEDALDPEFPRVLDLGTGTGKALLPFAGRLRNGLLVGIDRAPSMLAHAEEKFAHLFPSLTRAFALADAEKLDETLAPELAGFDAAVARFLFNFVDLGVTLPQVIKRIKRGGRIVFNVFAGFHWGYTDDFRRANPFEEARIKVARQVLEERLLPALTGAQRASLVASGNIRPRGDGSFEIISDPVTQKKGMDADSLRAALKAAGFEDIIIEPVAEMYPAEEKHKSFKLTKSIPYWWDIMNLIGDDVALRMELVEEIERRMPAEFRTGEHRFTDVFVSARRPGASGAPEIGGEPEPEITFVRNTAKLLADEPAKVSDARRKLFFDLVAANPDTFEDFYRRGLVAFGKTPMDEVYRDYGQEVILEANRRNLYAFLEPILECILSEKPDTILMIDNGARPLEALIKKFLEEFGLDIPVKFVLVSAQSQGQDVVDAYRLLACEQESIDGRHVMVIDDNVVRLKTGPALDHALQVLGAKCVSFAAMAAFNRKARDFADVATVRLPGTSMWIDPKRGLVSWTEWEANPEITRQSTEAETEFREEALANFAAELTLHREKLKLVAETRIVRESRREKITGDEKVLLQFISSDEWEDDFIGRIRSGRTVIESERLRRLIERYVTDRNGDKKQYLLGELEVERRSVGWGRRHSIDLAGGIDLRFCLRQYLRHGDEVEEIIFDPQVHFIRFFEDDEDRGFVRLIEIKNDDGTKSFVIDRIDPDYDLDARAESLVEKVVGFVSLLAIAGHYKELLISGRDFALSRRGDVRDVFNRFYKDRPDVLVPGHSTLKKILS